MSHQERKEHEEKEEVSVAATQQRAEQNFILTGIRNSIKGIGGAVLTMMAAGILVLISDHFKLDALVTAHAQQLATTELNSKRITQLEKSVRSPSSIWSYGMHMSFTNALKQLNPTFSTPDSAAIHDQHMADMNP